MATDEALLLKSRIEVDMKNPHRPVMVDEPMDKTCPWARMAGKSQYDESCHEKKCGAYDTCQLLGPALKKLAEMVEQVSKAIVAR